MFRISRPYTGRGGPGVRNVAPGSRNRKARLNGVEPPMPRPAAPRFKPSRYHPSVGSSRAGTNEDNDMNASGSRTPAKDESGRTETMSNLPRPTDRLPPMP